MIDKDNLDIFALDGLRNALALCKDHEYGADFLEPYPWQTEELERFPELIPESIGLSIIEQRLDDGSYINAKGLDPARFWEDLDKIWDDTQLVFDAYYEYESDFMLLEKSRVLRALMQDLEDDFWTNLDRYEATIEAIVQERRSQQKGLPDEKDDAEGAGTDDQGVYDGVAAVTDWFEGVIDRIRQAASPEASDDETTFDSKSVTEVPAHSVWFTLRDSLPSFASCTVRENCARHGVLRNSSTKATKMEPKLYTISNECA